MMVAVGLANPDIPKKSACFVIKLCTSVKKWLPHRSQVLQEFEQLLPLRLGYCRVTDWSAFPYPIQQNQWFWAWPTLTGMWWNSIVRSENYTGYCIVLYIKVRGYNMIYLDITQYSDLNLSITILLCRRNIPSRIIPDIIRYKGYCIDQ